MTEDLCRAKFEEWFKPRKEWMMATGSSTLSIILSHRRQFEAWQAAWNTRAEMEKSDG